MVWVLAALGGYFFLAVSAVFDKFLLADRIKAPSVYAFFVALFSLFSLFFTPFGFEFFGWRLTGIFFLSGILFLYGLVAFYIAVKESEVSRIAPLVGTVVSLVAFITVFFPLTGGRTEFDLLHALSLVLLIGGGLLISFDLPLHKGEHIPKMVVLAGLATGLSILLLKYGYTQANFVSGLIWSRLGILIGGLTLLLIPLYRKEIFTEISHMSRHSTRAASTGTLFVINKTSGGIAAFLIAYATSLGPVSSVQALSGMQYVFILLLTLPLALRFPKIFGETLFFWDWFQKVCAVILIGIGLWLLASAGVHVRL